MEPGKSPFGGSAGLFSSSNSSTAGNLFASLTGPKPAATSGNLFGSTANNLSQAAPSSTTPQSSPAKPGLFGSAAAGSGSSTGTPNFFGANNSNTSSNQAPKTSIFSPGNPSANTQNSQDGKTTTTPSIFSGTAPATGSTPASNIFATKPAEPSSTNASPSLFGAPSAANSSQQGSTPATTSLFGSASAKPATANEPPKPASNLFGNTSNSLFAAKSTAPAKSSPLATNSSVPGDASTQQQLKPQQQPQQQSQQQQSQKQPTAPLTPVSAAASKTSTTSVPSLLRGKTLEDLVARWNSELEDRVADFKHTANEIAAWDQVLIQNGDQISMLYEELQRIDPIQSSIDQTLDFVETQQNELSNALQEYERQLSDQPQNFSTPGRLKTAAQEREEAYKTAEEVHVQLDDMANSLGSMIAELNSLAQTNNRGGGEDFESSSAEDPIVQIAGILNAHLSSLNWISDTAKELSSKVEELEGRVSATKTEFGLESRQAQYNGNEEINGSINRNFTNRLIAPRG